MDSEEIRFGTYKKKESTFRIYISDKLGEYTLDKLTPKLLRDFRNDLGAVDIVSTQKNYVLQTLISAFEYARIYYNFDKDLSIYLERFPKTDKEHQRKKERFSAMWTEKEFNSFINGMEENYVLLFTLMFEHGLRVGEAQALRYKDVDFDAKTIDINGSITRKTSRGQYQRSYPKTISSVRKLFIGDTVNLIRDQYDANQCYYGFNDEWYVTKGSHPLSDKMIQRKREKHIKLSGVPKCGNHDMRHMFVSNAWSSGVPITAISAYVGHKTVAETLETYSHLTKEDDDKMLDYIKKLK